LPQRSRAGANLKGYVLDLRNNPAALLNQAVEIHENALVEQRRHCFDPRREIRTRGSITPPAPASILTQEKPVVVLSMAVRRRIRGSFCRRLQDLKRATLIARELRQGVRLRPSCRYGENGASECEADHRPAIHAFGPARSKAKGIDRTSECSKTFLTT